MICAVWMASGELASASRHGVPVRYAYTSGRRFWLVLAYWTADARSLQFLIRSRVFEDIVRGMSRPHLDRHGYPPVSVRPNVVPLAMAQKPKNRSHGAIPAPSCIDRCRP